MTETRPIYTTRQRHDDPDANAAVIIEATRRETTNRALDDAGAAIAGLLALVAEVDRLRGLLALGGLDAAHAELETVSTAHDIMADAYNALSIDFAALRAAGEWRPVTEKPVADDEYLVWCSSYEGCEIQSYSSRLNRWYSNAGNDADYWRPLPPRPDAAEATE